MNKWKKNPAANNRPAASSKSNVRPTLAGSGFMGRLGYYLNRAVINLRQNVFVNVVTVGTITLALLIVSLFLLVFVNLENAAENWSEKVQVTVYFDRELPPQEQTTLKSRIIAIPGAAAAVYVSRDEALKRFKGRLRGQETLLEGVRSEIMPTSFEISLKRSHRDSQGVESFVSALKGIQGINEIQYGEEWVRRFNTFLNYMRMLGAFLGGFLVIAVIFIVSNTIRLTIYARREELEIMSLVGATPFFIKAPFLIEGLIQGGLGAISSLLLLFLLYEAFLHNAGSFITFNPATAGLAFLPWEYVAGIMLAGVLLGFLGSLTSLKRFITI